MLNKLKSGEEIQQQLETNAEDLKTKQKTLESIEQKEKRLEHDKKIMEEREKLLERQKTLNGAIKWEKFKSMRKTAKDTRDRQRKLKEELTVLVETLEPIRKFLQEYDRKNKQVKEEYDETERELQEVNFGRKH